MSIMRIDQNLSLMIPRVFPQWVDEATIVDIFHKQHLGQVYKVSIIRQPDSKRRNYPIYQAFIYFSAWYENEIAYNFQQRIFGPKKQARIVYDDPWFWVAFENKKQRLSKNDKRAMRISNKSWQTLNAIDERLTECEDIMREIKETTEAQKRFLMEISSIKKDDGLCETIDTFLAEQETEIADATHSLLDTEMPELINSSFKAGPQHISWNHLNLQATATAMLCDELELTETAMNVAESALYEEEEETARYQDEEALTFYERLEAESNAMSVHW